MNQHSAIKTSHVFCATLVCTLALLAGLSVIGCRSAGGPASGSFASVMITNHTGAEIEAAMVKVFGNAGYQGGKTPQGPLVFERAGSRAANISREGIAGTFYGAQTVERVRAEIVGFADGRHRLQCKAYMVTGGSDPFFQDEVPLAHMRRGPYQALLNEVAKELQ